MKNIESQIQQQFRDISKINIMERSKDDAEYAVNEALKIGWQILSINFNERQARFIFVMGWPGFSKAPLTNREK